jgi:hypothetical protein
VVFPASGCEIIPNVLLRCISSKKLIIAIMECKNTIYFTK